MAEEYPPRMGWSRTFVLAAAAGVFAFAGVLAGAYALHVVRRRSMA